MKTMILGAICMAGALITLGSKVGVSSPRGGNVPEAIADAESAAKPTVVFDSGETRLLRVIDELGTICYLYEVSGQGRSPAMNCFRN